MSKEIKSQINEEIRKQADILKAHYGLNSDSEFLRVLIRKQYKETIEKAQLNESVKPSEKEVLQDV